MSAMLPTGSKTPTRRALLAGAFGGLGALAASAIGRASPVRAEGEAIVVGGEYFDATSVTRIANVSTTAPVFLANGDAGGTGIRGTSTTSIGVEGLSNSGTGVRGASNLAVGVRGVSGANVDVGGGDKAGVLGEGTHPSGTQTVGVWGRSGNNVGVYGTSQTSNGVSGVSGSAAGVFGGSTSGRGVFGLSSSAQGVYGSGPIGVEGTSNSVHAYGVGGYNTVPGGIGVFGQASGGLGRGVAGFSAAGRAVQGDSNTGWAGYFNGKVFTSRYVELAEVATPATAPNDRARLFVRATAAGKTQLCVRFQTGAVKVLATET